MSIVPKIRKHSMATAFWVIAFICVLVMFKTTADPSLHAISGSWLEYALHQFPTGNQISSDIAVGILVSQFMYVLVVWLPERRKSQRVRINLERQYRALKEACIMNFLFACNEPAQSDLIQKLINRQSFKAFFSESINESQNRWHAVLNGLAPQHIEDIRIELEIFKGELEYALNAIDITDEAAFLFLRRLTQVLHRSKNWSEEQDQLKALSQFMWSIFTGWSGIEGYTNRDRIMEMFRKI